MATPDSSRAPNPNPGPAQQIPPSAALPQGAQPPQKLIGVPMPLAQALTDYLSKQPYCEVVTFINSLQQCQIFDIVENAS